MELHFPSCLFNFFLVKVLSSEVVKYWLRHEKDLNYAFSTSFFTTSWLCLLCLCTANPYILLCARRTSPGRNGRGSALPNCSPSETPARSTSVAGEEHLAQFGGAESKPEAGMGSLLSLNHVGLENSYVVAKPWPHRRNCGIPELVEIFVRCPVLF